MTASLCRLLADDPTGAFGVSTVARGLKMRLCREMQSRAEHTGLAAGYRGEQGRAAGCSDGATVGWRGPGEAGAMGSPVCFRSPIVTPGQARELSDFERTKSRTNER